MLSRSAIFPRLLTKHAHEQTNSTYVRDSATTNILNSKTFDEIQKKNSNLHLQLSPENLCLHAIQTFASTCEI